MATRRPWTEFQTGKTFGSSDIRSARSAGYNDNQIMKMAARSPYVERSANRQLMEFNKQYTTPQTNTIWAQGSQRDYRAIGQSLTFPKGLPENLVTWNGLNANGTANALTINRQGADPWGIYTPADKRGQAYGQWTIPSGLLPQQSAPAAAPPAAAPTEPAPTTKGPNSAEIMPDGWSLGGGGRNKSAMAQNGMGAEVNMSAPGIRRKKSSMQISGKATAGAGKLKINRTASGVGLNYN